MESILGLIGLLMLELVVLPASVYLCVKAGRLAYLNASSQHNQREKGDHGGS